MDDRGDARQLLSGLVGRQLLTLTGRRNEILRLEGPDVVVATERSPGGSAVPIAWVQDALDMLRADGELNIDVPTVGYRSAFIGAVLRELPGAEVFTNPRRIVLQTGGSADDGRAVELARRERMWGELLGGEGSDEASAQELRRIRIYGSAGGVWVDKAATAAASSSGSGVAVSVLHTGRRYPDLLSEDGMTYRYPRTERPPARDESEIEALKECARQRLPLFVITEAGAGSRRMVRRGWVEGWNDDAGEALIGFSEKAPAGVPDDEGEPFELFGRPDGARSSVRSRPNQQRFRLAVLRRYGVGCAMCSVSAPELLKAAHLVPVKAKGSDHPGNGLPLCGNHHDALDEGLVGIEPETLALVCDGVYTAAELGITREDLKHLRVPPHPSALQELWRHRHRV